MSDVVGDGVVAAEGVRFGDPTLGGDAGTDAEMTAAENAAARAEASRPALGLFRRIHPFGYVCFGVLIAAALWHTVFDTERLIGNMAWWQWLAVAAMAALCCLPAALNALRKGIEFLADISLKIVWVFAWLVFIVQLFNVITRYMNPLFESDILIGQMTSLAWQLFAAISLIGLNYGVKAGVNPRVDFWWAEWSDKRKAWLDFIMHVFLFLPFLYMSVRILRPYAAISLGRKRSGEWPSGWKVWETWEKSGDADQLPVGGIKAILFVGFVLFALQILAEIIKVGFVLMGRDDLAEVTQGDEFQRIE